MKARIPNQGGNSQAAMMKKLQDMQAEMNRTQQEVEEAEYVASANLTVKNGSFTPVFLFICFFLLRLRFFRGIINEI